MKSLMKKDDAVINDFYGEIETVWDKKKVIFGAPKNLEIKQYFTSCSEIVIYFIRSVITFNIHKTSLQ